MGLLLTFCEPLKEEDILNDVPLPPFGGKTHEKKIAAPPTA